MITRRVKVRAGENKEKGRASARPFLILAYRR